MKQIRKFPRLTNGGIKLNIKVTNSRVFKPVNKVNMDKGNSDDAASKWTLFFNMGTASFTTISFVLHNVVNYEKPFEPKH